MPELGLRIPRKAVPRSTSQEVPKSSLPLKELSIEKPTNRLIEILNRLRTHPDEQRLELRKACALDLTDREAIDILLFLKQRNRLRFHPEVIERALDVIASSKHPELVCRGIGFLAHDFYDQLPKLIRKVHPGRVLTFDAELLTYLLYGCSRVKETNEDVLSQALKHSMLNRWCEIYNTLTPRQMAQSALALLAIEDPVHYPRVAKCFASWASNCPPPNEKDLIAYSEISARLENQGPVVCSAMNCLLRKIRTDAFSDLNSFLAFLESVKLVADPSVVADTIQKFLLISGDRLSDLDRVSLLKIAKSLQRGDKAKKGKDPRGSDRSALSDLA